MRQNTKSTIDILEFSSTFFSEYQWFSSWSTLDSLRVEQDSVTFCWNSTGFGRCSVARSSESPFRKCLLLLIRLVVWAGRNWEHEDWHWDLPFRRRIDFSLFWSVPKMFWNDLVVKELQFRFPWTPMICTTFYINDWPYFCSSWILQWILDRWSLLKNVYSLHWVSTPPCPSCKLGFVMK